MGFLSVQSIIPPGITLPYSGTVNPSGWLLCDGSAISRTVYSALFAAISTTYGVGDGSTTFNLPDLRGRTIIGKDVLVTSYADRVTSANALIDSRILGASGGTETHLLTAAQAAQKSISAVSGGSNTSLAHNHSAISNGGTGGGSTVANWTVSAASGANSSTFGSTGNTDLTSHTHTVAISGTNALFAHQNTQPSIVLNYIVKI